VIISYCVLLCELTCTKLFPHIARAAFRDASRESSQIDANLFAILVVIPHREKKTEGRKRMWKYLVEKGQHTAIIAIL